MISSSLSSLLLFLSLASSSAIQSRSTTLCGQYESTSAGTYTLFTNLWGEKNATSGSQCSTLESVNGNTIAWSTTWNWVGGSAIKSYSNIQQNAGANRKLNEITSMRSVWHWHQSNTAVTADVAFDLFTSSTARGRSENELMIWLANYNSGPISYHYNTNGAIPVATNLNIAGHTWNFFTGFNGANKVHSFVLTRGTAPSFSGDIYPFFKYLIENKYVDSAQYLTIAQGGTEATSGSATFSTSAYSLVIS